MDNFLYHQFFYNHPEPAWIVDDETYRFVDVNPIASEVYGYGRKEMLGMTIFDVVIGLEGERFNELYAILQRDKRLQFRASHRIKSGEVIDMMVSVSAMVTEEGKRYLMGVCLNTIELKEREQQFEAIFSNIEEGMSIEELATGRFVACNDYMSRMFGYSKEELLQRGVKDLIPPGEMERFGRSKPLMDGGEQTLLREKPVMRKDGSIFYADIDASRPYTIAGRHYVAALVRDVTKSRETRHELLASRKKFIALFNRMPESAWVIDAKTARFIDCNQANEQQYGYSREEFLQMRIEDLEYYDGPEKVKERVEHLLREGFATFETKHRTKDGRVLDVVVSGQLLLLGESPSLIVTCHDITVRKEREHFLKNLNEELEARVNKALDKHIRQQKLILDQSKLAIRGEMISNIAHQWRQPLNVTALAIQNIALMTESEEFSHEQLDELVVQAMAQIQYLSEVVNKFSRFFDSNDDVSLFSVTNVLKETIGLLEGRLHENAITVEIEGDDISLEGKVNDFKQIMLVLFNNAVEAIVKQRDDVAEHQGRITILLDQSDGKKIIAFRDNGIGVDPEIRERVFDPYFTTKFQAQDVGISLYMAKMLVERNLGGLLTLGASRPGETEFIIEVS